MMPGFLADPIGELYEPKAGVKVLPWSYWFVLFFKGF